MINSIQKTLKYIWFMVLYSITDFFQIELYYNYYTVWSKKFHITYICRKNKYSDITEFRTMFCEPFTNYWVEFDGELT